MAMGIGLVAAPAASATTAGCGELTNGLLCLDKLTPRESGDYRVQYDRYSGSGALSVKMGIQHKSEGYNPKAFTWLGTDTVSAGGSVWSDKRYYTITDGDCLRGGMVAGGKSFVTKWRCF
ncbi:hypothetical protein GCM10018773_65320 [Streptomyces candidus]|nr:hypothetical protein GCM10018773_65320 [Streptomyces candidus]